MNGSLRQTKILATLGPATDDPGVLAELFAAGVDVVRLNFSHGDTDSHLSRARAIQDLADKTGRFVGIMVDLQGPKIRITGFREQQVRLISGRQFRIDTALDKNEGSDQTVGCTYDHLHEDVKPGDTLLLDDGRITLNVVRIENTAVVCEVVAGGILTANKGINRQGGGLSVEALTEKDRRDIKTAAKMGADYVAISFPKSAADIHEARKLLAAAGSKAGVVAKIERAEALDDIDAIIEASNAIMVARGDLGVEIGDASLPPVQKKLIDSARKMDTVVIIATQMMESMIHNPLPTRAEVFDVANAVFDGTDAVMLSAESAAGKYPVNAVKAMDRVCLEAEKQSGVQIFDQNQSFKYGRTDEAIAKSSMFVANHTELAAIIAHTESGSTPLWMSRMGSSIPIFAFTPHTSTCRRVTLYRSVYPVIFDRKTRDHAELNQLIIDLLKRRGVVKNGDQAIITKGDLEGVQGCTNAMKIVRVGEGLVA